MEKKPYVKPMIVFENFRTGELTGSSEMIAQIREEAKKYSAEAERMCCPFDPMTCWM